MKPVKIAVKPKLVPPAPPPPPPPAPEPVAVTKFEAPVEAPLPPPPPQINAPVGPPPPPSEPPSDYEGFMSVALRARTGRLDFAQFWATLAQAEAQKEIADNLSELLEFLGARGDEDDDGAPRFANELAAGLLIAKEQTRERMAQALAETKDAKPPPQGD